MKLGTSHALVRSLQTKARLFMIKRAPATQGRPVDDVRRTALVLGMAGPTWLLILGFRDFRLPWLALDSLRNAHFDASFRREGSSFVNEFLTQ